jgi:hypothetical protein
MSTKPDPIAAADAALDRVVAVQAQIDALTAERARALLAFDEAFTAAYPPAAEPFRDRAARAELACALRMPERSVETLLGESRVLTRLLPATLAALSEGRFSYRHAQALVDETGHLDDHDRRAVERIALGSAGTTTVARFRRQVRRLRERRDPSTSVARARDAFARRELTLEPSRDGIAYLTLSTNAVDAAAIFERATAAAGRALSGGDTRTLAQLRVDVLVDALLERDSTLGLSRSQLEAMDATPDELLAEQELGLGPFAGIVPTVVVTVPVHTLLGGDEPGTLEGVGPIDAATARRLTAQAPALYRLLTDAETGVALSLSRTTYRVPDNLRRWLRIRDGSCRFPMCSANPRRCDLDHTVDWTGRDGPTDHDNLAHLSRGHHTLKHHGGWRVRQTRGGTLTWSSYLGREYTTLADAA